jgi:hypothetical protein
MRNITVSIDDETYKRARVAAAERDTSLSALVKSYLEQLAATETDNERRKRLEAEIRAKIVGFDGSVRLSREDLYRRAE